MSARELSQRECSTSWRCERESCINILMLARRRCTIRLSRASKKRQRQALGKLLSASLPPEQSRTEAVSSNGAVPLAAPAVDSQSLCSVFGSTAVTACTDFVAETLLPTTSGHYRLRGYRHTIEFVSSLWRIKSALRSVSQRHPNKYRIGRGMDTSTVPFDQ